MGGAQWGYTVTYIHSGVILSCPIGCVTKMFGYVSKTLLNDMAPIRKLTKRKIGLEQHPWITKGFLHEETR